MGGQTVKNSLWLACKFDLDQNERKSSQVNASARKPWPNGVASRPKFSTCVYLRLGLARALESVNWNLSSFFSLVAVSFHASHPYNRTGRTKVLNSLIFVFRPMLREFQILFNLKKARAPRALLSRFLMSSVPPLSFGPVIPRYTNSSTSSASSLPIIILSSLRVSSSSSLCISEHSAFSVPAFLHYLLVGWSCSVCVRI